MTNERILRDYESVHGFVSRVCFKNGPPHQVGAELEWLVTPVDDPSSPVPLDRLQHLLTQAAPLPAASRITLEPGGQVELSSQPAPSLDQCCDDLRVDLAELTRMLGSVGLQRACAAVDPLRAPRRVLLTPRYDAMQAYFDRRGDAGLAMMAATASIQVNLDAGADAVDIARRWSVLHAVGPSMVAAFANSPVRQGRVTGWLSTRQQILQQLDRTAAPFGPDPVTAWADYAWRAQVMIERRPGRWTAAGGYTFGDWVGGAGGTGRPTEDDLCYHLTTLFPPVRPRGWYEVRYVDAQSSDFWSVPIAVLTALTGDAHATDQALAATEATVDRWADAARSGLRDPALGQAALHCFEIAFAALSRLGVSADLQRTVQDFAERYVLRSRSPADDRLAEHSSPIVSTGALR